jgi:predicted amidohydrolase
LRIATAQACPEPSDIVANTATAAMVREAAQHSGAQVVVFPEKFLTGYEPDLIRADPERCAVQAAGDERLDPLLTACRDTGTVAIVGTAVHDSGELTVSALVLDSDGTWTTRYDKQMLFRTERDVYRPGDRGALPGHRRLAARPRRLLRLRLPRARPRRSTRRLPRLPGGRAVQRRQRLSRVPDVVPGPGVRQHHVHGAVQSRRFHGRLGRVRHSDVWGPFGRLVTEAGPDVRELLVADLARTA